MKYVIFMIVFFVFHASACDDSKKNYLRFLEYVSSEYNESKKCREVWILFEREYTDKKLHLVGANLVVKNGNRVEIEVAPKFHDHGDGIRSAYFCISETLYKNAILQFSFSDLTNVEISKSGNISVSDSLCGAFEEDQIVNLVNYHNKSVKADP